MKRRDHLRALEAEVQQWWQSENVFNAYVDKSKPKFFVNFPYPYMNGRLHLGHAFSLTKTEFTANYQRLLGKNVLWPFAYHCTGMPIQAAAFKLKREIELYGEPPVLPKDNEDHKGTSKKSKKTQAKEGNIKLQWDIMKLMGIDENEIPKFVDPKYWLEYFPPKAEHDLKRFGLSCDFRRSFITTDVNIYYDKFIRWQFYKLKENGKIQFGKRPTIYSPLDKQACMDHDRSSGEGVGPQEYTLVKLKVIDSEENYDKVSKELFKKYPKGIYLVAATLRPETMYGQTNCFILPDGEYSMVEMKTGEVFVCSQRSARNMSYQDLTKEFGKVDEIGKIKGKQLVGVALDAPRTKYDRIYTLPLLTISMKKGTGVVTSVPSDAPDDYAALKDWQTNEQLRKKYNVAKEWVEGYEVVPIIEIPGLGNQAAVTLCQERKVKSQKDKAKLAEIKAEVYKKGFYEGIMIVGNEAIKGKKVCDVKDIAKEQMVAANEALVYYEPENEVKSRSGDECVVVYLDQWYITYGEEKWKKAVSDHVNSDNFEAYFTQNLKSFNDTLDWLSDWACSRSFGLGSRVPWDEQFLIESLSDSTIYMAYYTISHLLQGRVDGGYSGKGGSPSGITFDKDSDEVSNQLFDYIFLGKGEDQLEALAKKLGKDVQVDSLVKMREEFEYWYPFNLRSSGKDLIKNHLTMTLYNHAAIWPDQPEKWPRGYFCNGQVMVDAVKMSKSVGNFIMLSEATHGHRTANIAGKEVTIGWCADATRFTCADSGDTLEDANFSCDTANTIILRLTTELELMKTILHKKLDSDSSDIERSFASLRIGDKDSWNFHDISFYNKFNHNVNETKAAYEAMRFRDVVKFGYYNMQTCRDIYRDACVKMGIDMNEELIKEFIRKQIIILAPICPHFCEYAWRKLLDNTTSVFKASFPEPVGIDIVAMRRSEFVDDLITKSRKKALELQNKGQNTETMTLKIVISDKFTDWKLKLFDFVKEHYDTETRSVPKTALKALKQFCLSNADLKPMMKRAMQVGAFIIKRTETEYERAFEKELIFDQVAVLKENESYIARSVGVGKVELLSAEAVGDKESEPGTPTFTIE